MFRNGANQAVRIPREFEFSSAEVILSRDGDRLIISPAETQSRLIEVLESLEPLPEAFPDVDHGLRPLDPVRL